MEFISIIKDIFITLVEKIDEYFSEKKIEFLINSNKNQFEIVNNGQQSIYNYMILLDGVNIKEIANFSRFVKSKDFSILKSKESIIIKRIPDGNQKDDYKLTIMYHKKKKSKKVYKEDYNITI